MKLVVKKSKNRSSKKKKNKFRQSYAAKHYSASINNAIIDRLNAMHDVDMELRATYRNISRSDAFAANFIQDMEEILSNTFCSIEEYVDDDEAHVDKAVAEIRSALGRLSGLIELGTPTPRAMRREISKIRLVVENERSRYDRAPTPGAL
ncbi:hypothetical protein N2601_16920 [Rhizobium sp. CB3060]|uniref:hypothetical protein n=1 Tax=Rhizobium sp. CB3060 TaxID=3138255 RepID=UPI0021A4777E|nr:hypothetical protein [Rhizobium tropici]UWU20923.1 hypothetical protein N2601_16920 [Rhizobium tropici]